MKVLLSLILGLVVAILLWGGPVYSVDHLQDATATPDASETPRLQITGLAVNPQMVVAGDTFQITFRLKNNHTGIIGYLSATISDADGIPGLSSPLGSQLFVLPNLVPDEARTFGFEFVYSPSTSGTRSLLLEVDYVYLLSGIETIGKQTATLSLNVQTPTATPTATATPTVLATIVTTPIQSPTVAPIVTPIPLQLTISGPAGANIRSGPGLDYPILFAAQAGQSFPVTGRTADNSWWQLRLPEGTVAWVWGNLAVAVNGDLAPVISAIPPPPPTPIPTVTSSALPSPTIEPSTTVVTPAPEQERGFHNPQSQLPGRNLLPDLSLLQFMEGSRAHLAPEITQQPNGSPMIYPGTYFTLTVTIHNVSSTPVEAVVLQWQEITTVVGIGRGSVWYLGNISSGRDIAMDGRFYVSRQAEPGIYGLVGLVEYRQSNGQDFATPVSIYIVVDDPDEDAGLSTTPAETKAEQGWFERLLQSLFGR